MAELKIQEFTYPLPQGRIALHPLAERDQSKLLVYNGGRITHSDFATLPEHLPAGTCLYFNNTRVIPARVYFQKDTGALIEVFLLHPISPSSLLIDVMSARGKCVWQCAIGNLKRWKSGTSLRQLFGTVELEASIIDRGKGVVEFRWTDQLTFAEVVTVAGETPLPPYLNRKPETEDRHRYQTVYSEHEGAVAAPTAGLHFSNNMFERLRMKGFSSDFLTLHVSAGTFQPIKTENALQHVMHQEQLVITRNNIAGLLDERFVIPVGTTSMRTLESIYWFGTKLLKDPNTRFVVTQHDPYDIAESPAREAALHAILKKMDALGVDSLTGETSIFIRPGYTFRMCHGLITNFHQPASTLILLVAAFIGKDWKGVYDEALSNDYRFLSYGDSSLLIPVVDKR
jgi:S-adenosylmethionine:tRNA ribosyltransferase-isomerase